MGRIIVRSLGPIRGPWREAAIEYLRRIEGRLPLRWEEGEEVRVPRKASEADLERVRRLEAERLVRGIAQGSELWALDPRGRELDSLEFTRLVAQFRRTERSVYLLVGGHLGLDPQLSERCEQLSLSRLTFSHQMVPAILLEQIYRAESILAGGPYHR